MAEIEKFIQDLHSDNPDKRFQACNQLFYAHRIPDNAIEALHEATQDSDPRVANAAERALDVHSNEIRPYPQSEETIDKYGRISLTRLNRISLSFWAAFISVITIFVISIIGMNFVDKYLFDPLNYFAFFCMIIYPLTSITSATVTLILFWKRPVPIFSNVRITAGVISTIVGMISAIFWGLVGFGLWK